VGLQVQLAIAYGLEEVLSKLENKYGDAKDKLSIERRNNETPHSWKSVGPQQQTDNGNSTNEDTFTALEIIQANKRLREKEVGNSSGDMFKSLSGKAMKRVLRQQVDLFLQTHVFRSTHTQSGHNSDYVDTDPLPIGVAQSVVSAIEGVTHCLVAALVEDTRGVCLQTLPTVLSSLIALSITIEDHTDLVRRYCLLTPNRPRKLLSSFPKDRVMNTSMCACMLALRVAVDEGLNRCLRAYRDQLTGGSRCVYAFPVAYSKIIEERLKQL
jgi:hypothetical protein